MVDENLKTMIKNSLYGFFREYDTFEHCRNSPLNSEVNGMLEKYRKKYNSILINQHDMLPKELEDDIQNLTYSITNVLKSIKSIETDLLSLVSVCADKALEIYNNFDDYFDDSQEAKYYPQGCGIEPCYNTGNSAYTITVNGNNSPVIIDSNDNHIYTDMENVNNMNVFEKLRDSISINTDGENKEELLSSVNEMEKAKGTSEYANAYRSFMRVAKDCITIVTPFIPYLSDYLS